MEANLIHCIEIRNLWRKYDLIWKDLNADVNILIGINGSGKTTFFNILDAIFTADVKRLKLYGVSVTVEVNDFIVNYNPKTPVSELKNALSGIRYQKISTFDVPMKDRPKAGKEYSQLYNELARYCLQYRRGSSFFFGLSLESYQLSGSGCKNQ